MIKKILKTIGFVIAIASLPALSVLAFLQEKENHNPKLGLIVGLLLIVNQVWIIGGFSLFIHHRSQNSK